MLAFEEEIAELKKVVDAKRVEAERMRVAQQRVQSSQAVRTNPTVSTSPVSVGAAAFSGEAPQWAADMVKSQGALAEALDRNSTQLAQQFDLMRTLLATFGASEPKKRRVASEEPVGETAQSPAAGAAPAASASDLVATDALSPFTANVNSAPADMSDGLATVPDQQQPSPDPSEADDDADEEESEDTEAKDEKKKECEEPKN